MTRRYLLPADTTAGALGAGALAEQLQGALHEGEMIDCQVHGPTCDSTDTLPGLVPLPADIRAGDYLEFGNIGAYSLGGRTDYNGFYSDRIVNITSPTALPPDISGPVRL